jgi:hypothetical protein
LSIIAIFNHIDNYLVNTIAPHIKVAVFRGKGFQAHADRAATNGGTLEARRAGTNTAA